MSKLLMGLFLCVCVTHKALCLTCYTSNFSSWLTGNVHKLKHKLQECSDYINEFSSTEVPVKETLQCFTITSDYPDLALKGCLPQGPCDSMVISFQQMIQRSGEISLGAMGNVECQMCDKDACNSEAEDSFYIPNNISTSEVSSPQIKVVTTASTHNCANAICLIKIDYSRCLFFIMLYYYSLHYG